MKINGAEVRKLHSVYPLPIYIFTFPHLLNELPALWYSTHVQFNTMNYKCLL
jgi:hypothetical protein